MDALTQHINLDEVEIARNAVRGLMREVEYYTRHQPDDEWLNQLVIIMNQIDAFQEGFNHIRAIILAHIYRAWDDLPFDVRKLYSLSFEVFCIRHVPGLSWETIRNHIRMAETFYLDNRRPLGKIPIPVRRNGKQVYENNKAVVEYIEWDPQTVPMSKLVLARHAVESGTITETQWSQLADPHVRYEDFRRALKDPTSSGEPQIRFVWEGPYLVALHYGEAIPLMEVVCWDAFYDVDHPHHEPARRAVTTLCKALGALLDDEGG